MASSFTSSIFDNSAETTNGVKLMRLIVDGGTEALRKTFTRYLGGNLQQVLSTSQPTLSKLKNSIIKQKQWGKLYPAPPNHPDINDFDITLLGILLRHIKSALAPPNSSVWKNEPNVSDNSVQADIVRVRLFRNERFGHIPNTSVSTADFKTFWAEVSSPLVRLGIDQREIYRLENEKCGVEEVERVFEVWNKCETEIIASLHRIEHRVGKMDHSLQTIVSKQDIRSESILDKQLVCLDFQPEIEMYYEKFTRGTREWVFEQVFSWFHDDASNNRAFVISAPPGMGKSVISAVICKRFAEHVGAHHFFQYNNSRYSNPNSLLQSLAWQVCKVIPAYKEDLMKKLSRNLGQSLNNMNVEGLFSFLFKEPFSCIAGNGMRVLIVLDALDESGHEGRLDLANLIGNHFHKLPSNIRFLITTRPEKNLIEKFEKLNPLFIEANDKRNLNDIKLVLQKKISCVSGTVDLIDILADKSDGLMLYAFFLSEICKDKPSTFRVADFPQGVRKFYEKYVERLKRDLKDHLEISKDKFLAFLSALSVALEPLPEAFIGSLFGFEKNSPSTKAKVNKAMNMLSSLLVVKENQSVSFFHKSLRDWLVDNSRHDYSVEEQCGHKILFDLCVVELNKLKKTGVKDSAQTIGFAFKYALKYYIPHMVNGTENDGSLECFANNLVADLQVMFASVCLDVDLTLNNMSSLMNHELYKLVSENTSTTVNELFFVGKKFAFLLRDCPQSFLQHVVNECDEELSFKASHLLKTRYKDIVYLEMVEKKRKRDAAEFRCVLSGELSGIDASPRHDYVVCSYRESGVELFSLATGKSEWKIQHFTLERPVLPSLQIGSRVMLAHCIVFHPRKSLILPGRLDMAFTLKGSLIKTELFQCGDNNAKFTNCCFSKDGSRLVTNYGLDLIVWNTLSGEEEIRLKCYSPLSTFSFTASGKFLGTTSKDNVFTVHDVMNQYVVVKSVTLPTLFPIEIVSTFEVNCWCLLFDTSIKIINEEHSVSTSCYSNVHNIVLPGNLCSCELECVFKRTKQNWFLQVRQYLNSTFGWSAYTALRYIEIGDKGVLVFSRSLNYMIFFNKKDLMGAGEQAVNMKGVFSNISTKGDFVYLNNMWKKEIMVHVLDSSQTFSIPRPQLNQFYLPVVRNGVILFGENCTPNLWNCDLSKCVVSFDELAGTEKCLSVSEKIIACICKSYIIFFDAVCGKIVHHMTFTEDAKLVHACRSKYHVLVEINLWKDGVKVDGWMDVFCKYTGLRSIFSAAFSPDGNRLALVSVETNKIFIFNVVSVMFLSEVPVLGPENDVLLVKFLDNENLLCSSTNHVLYLINVERGEILACLDFGDIPALLSVSRERNIVCAGHNCSENFELIKVWLPRTT